MAFYIKYALSGGFGGVDSQDWEACDAATEKEAMDLAEELAKEEYYSYGGMYGLFNREDTLEDDPELTDEDLDAMEEEDMDSWLDYCVIDSDTDLTI